MIFKPEMVEAILSGRKTVTRRPVKPTASGGLHGADYLPCRYEVGKTYAVQPGRGKKAVARIRVLSVQRETLGAMRCHWGDCRKEGFANWASFKRYWNRLYPDGPHSPLVDRIEFELLPSPQEAV